MDDQLRRKVAGEKEEERPGGKKIIGPSNNKKTRNWKQRKRGKGTAKVKAPSPKDAQGKKGTEKKVLSTKEK